MTIKITDLQQVDKKKIITDTDYHGIKVPTQDASPSPTSIETDTSKTI